MTCLSAALESEIKNAFIADFQRTVQLENDLFQLRLDGTFRADVPSVVPEALRIERKYVPAFPILGFNGQTVRAAIFLTLMRTLRFDVFVETGTFRGETCVLVAAQTDLTIHTCELRHRSQAVAAVVTKILSNRVRASLIDSRAFLKQFFKEAQFSRPFFYLDAHWEADIPLLEELQIILSSVSEFVIVIDDFSVPGDPGFGFDVYGKIIFDWDYISAAVENHMERVSVFYPAYSSRLETGSRRGFVMIASKRLAVEIFEKIGPELLKSVPVTGARSRSEE